MRPTSASAPQSVPDQNSVDASQHPAPRAARYHPDHSADLMRRGQPNRQEERLPALALGRFREQMRGDGS